MKNFWILSFVLAVGLAAASFLPLDTAVAASDRFRFADAGTAIPNRYIVVMRDDLLQASRMSANDAADQLARDYDGTVDHVYEDVMRGFSVEMKPKMAMALSWDPRIEYIEEDALMYVSDVQPNATWGLDRADQRQLPLNGQFDFSSMGSGVHAYIIDTGIRTSHSEFGGRAVMSYNAVRDGNGAGDCHGHGTHVAGTVGGSTFGVAKNVMLHGIRVMNCQGSGTISDIVAGIDWVTRRHVKPAVVNMSLGGGGSTTLDSAVRESIGRGITYVIAAGNSNGQSCQYSPARVIEGITVAATNNLDTRAYFSNFGYCVDLFAPGVNITSAWNAADNSINTISGTSMAAPHVAGVAALYLETNPVASPGEVNQALAASATPGVVSDAMGSVNLLLYSSVTPPPPSSCQGTIYSGSVNSVGEAYFHDDPSGFSGGNGMYAGTLSSPDAQFELRLEKKRGNRWNTVLATTGTQRISTSGDSGTYRWKVTGLSGPGSYSVCSEVPF